MGIFEPYLGCRDGDVGKMICGDAGGLKGTSLVFRALMILAFFEPKHMLTLHRVKPIAVGTKEVDIPVSIWDWVPVSAKLYHTVFRVTGGYVCWKPIQYDC